MTSGLVTVNAIAALKLGEIATQLQRIEGIAPGKADCVSLRECANRLDELTRSKDFFLARRCEPLRKVLRVGFENAGVTIRSEAHLFDASRRLMKNIRGAQHIKGELLTQARSVCVEIDSIVQSPDSHKYFPN